MSSIMSKLDSSPQWVDLIVSEIDSLRFEAGFQRLASDAEMQFGCRRSIGPEAIQEHFRNLHVSINTKHEVLEVWSGSSQTYVRGEVRMTKKENGSKPSVEPFQWMFYEVGNDSIHRWLITAGPC